MPLLCGQQLLAELLGCGLAVQVRPLELSSQVLLPRLHIHQKRQAGHSHQQQEHSCCSSGQQGLQARSLPCAGVSEVLVYLCAKASQRLLDAGTDATCTAALLHRSAEPGLLWRRGFAHAELLPIDRWQQALREGR